MRSSMRSRTGSSIARWTSCNASFMLARMLEAPPGLDDAALTEELTDMVLRYLVTEPVTAPRTLERRGKATSRRAPVTQ